MVSQQLPAQDDVLQERSFCNCRATAGLEIEISTAATRMLLKHCENPALLGGSRSNQVEREMCHGSANHPSSWRPDPGSKRLAQMLFLEERTTMHRELLGSTGTWCREGSKGSSDTAQAGPP